jgi:hypothetical protein
MGFGQFAMLPRVELDLFLFPYRANPKALFHSNFVSATRNPEVGICCMLQTYSGIRTDTSVSLLILEELGSCTRLITGAQVRYPNLVGVYSVTRLDCRAS